LSSYEILTASREAARKHCFVTASHKGYDFVQVRTARGDEITELRKLVGEAYSWREARLNFIDPVTGQPKAKKLRRERRAAEHGQRMRALSRSRSSSPVPVSLPMTFERSRTQPEAVGASSIPSLMSLPEVVPVGRCARRVSTTSTVSRIEARPFQFLRSDRP